MLGDANQKRKETHFLMFYMANIFMKIRDVNGTSGLALPCRSAPSDR